MTKTLEIIIVLLLIPVVNICLVGFTYDWMNDYYPLQRGDLPWSLTVYYGARFYAVLVFVICLLHYLFKYKLIAIICGILLLVLLDWFFLKSLSSRPNRVLFIIGLSNLAVILSVLMSFIIVKLSKKKKPGESNDNIVDGELTDDV